MLLVRRRLEQMPHRLEQMLLEQVLAQAPERVLQLELVLVLRQAFRHKRRETMPTRRQREQSISWFFLIKSDCESLLGAWRDMLAVARARYSINFLQKS